ncbi:uncharacterized protein LOC119521112 [Choloepus didactylus]|uniref:uncharacterized protein LOC119521112 n=1 Tax=Choloepus didactylus TaxID=27675 RepID=UPI0018A075D6|nr:uncharacterized protein LOC119521112 [Choloepus didactylus]
MPCPPSFHLNVGVRWCLRCPTAPLIRPGAWPLCLSVFPSARPGVTAFRNVPEKGVYFRLCLPFLMLPSQVISPSPATSASTLESTLESLTPRASWTASQSVGSSAGSTSPQSTQMLSLIHSGRLKAPSSALLTPFHWTTYRNLDLNFCVGVPKTTSRVSDLLGDSGLGRESSSQLRFIQRKDAVGSQETRPELPEPSPRRVAREVLNSSSSTL